ncbi:MAG TPA: 1-acyl-sn-glycerol-3-phosphate acyltransferase [Ohtaekwangia sp.]|nr:1-acyl-sn-glycerol-3-phosphate acyltransferase [Ohtaekwangia sp.]
MTALLLSVFRYFQKNKLAFWLVLTGSILLMAAGASRVRLEEDITSIFPDDERVGKLSYIFKNSSFSDRVVVMVSVRDSSKAPQPDSLVAVASRLAEKMEIRLKPFDALVTARIDQTKVLQVFETAHRYLPVFLTEKDYETLDSISKLEVSRQVLRNNFRLLVSPAGIALKRMIVQDPTGFSFIVLKKLEQLQYDENIELYNDYIITKDHRHLIFFIQPASASAATGKNADFVEALKDIITTSNSTLADVHVSAFGAPIVAVGNATQLKKDTILTLSLLVILLSVFIYAFFRSKRVLLLILFPVVYGAVFSLCCIYLIQGNASILALAAGSVILGIAVNYALHLLVHLRQHPDKEKAIKDLVGPMTLGSTTTVLAFFSLQFTNAVVLKDIGLFAGFSLIGAAICSLVFLPHLVSLKKTAVDQRSSKLRIPFDKLRIPGIILIFLVTPVLFYFAGDVTFNSDMNKLNFMSPETREAQQRLETINPASLHTLYVPSDGESLQHALQKNERITPRLDSLRESGIVNKVHSVSALLISDSLQRLRIERWNAFWSDERRNSFLSAMHEEGEKLKFSPQVLARIDTLITKDYKIMDTASFNMLCNTFFLDNIIERDGEATVITLVNTTPPNTDRVYSVIANFPGAAFDRQMITKLFIEFVNDDFTFIVTFTSVLVFLVLLISYGKFELTLITFMPMLITWIWILGIMALVGIEFNIINVMISTFIFGLGDDYSIFVMDGLLQEYKHRKSVLFSIRISIFLSALTTISGLGVLIFAEHPALRSIAAIAIIGIVCVFIMSQTLEPFLFRWLITDRTKKGLPPMSLMGMILTFLTYSLFVIGSFFLTVVGLVFKIIPFGKDRLKLSYHHLIRIFTGAVLYLNFKLKKRILNLSSHTYSTPSVIIANHNSFLDILITTMLNPKVVLLTNKWVWNSPVFGGVVRLANYFPVMEGADDSVSRLKRKVDLGYSVVVFPEGTRSESGNIGRFHKGAFYLAEKLNLPITPLVIHGAYQGIPKNTFYVNDSVLTIRFLPRIEPDDLRYGTSYAERCKSISRYFKSEHAKIKNDPNQSDWFVDRLKSNYMYKGPVLEWYLEIKMRLEKNYKFFHEQVPHNASVLDLGCGYGFLPYTLHLLSGERSIHGVDYDEEKISIAENGYLRGSQLTFECADVSVYSDLQYDVIIMSDVLHYLLPEDQVALLKRCFHHLNPGGKIIIRDGNTDMRQRHKGTKLTELFSVKLLKFNKAVNPLTFVSGEQITRLAEEHGFVAEQFDHAKLTSNIIFVITKREGHHGKI